MIRYPLWAALINSIDNEGIFQKLIFLKDYFLVPIFKIVVLQMFRATYAEH